METRVTAKTIFSIDCAALRRGAALLKKSKRLSVPRVRSLSPLRVSVSGRDTIRRQVLRAATLAGPCSCAVPIETSESLQASRDLGWSRDFAKFYHLEPNQILGEGSFGIVKRATKVKNGKQCAVKLLPKNVPGEWERYAMLLQREVMHWEMMKECPQVVNLDGVYEDDEYVYIVQELCTGGDIQHLIRDHNGALTEDEVAQIIIPILKMLMECHEKHICFGDVKPANFMLKQSYPCKRHLADPSAPKGDLIVKGIDFGCSQKLSEDGKLKKRTGTPLYMAPEIFFGWYGMEVDIWAVGMMLYQLIAGKLPFFGDHAEQLKKGPTFMIVQAVMESELDFNGYPWEHISDECKELIQGLLDIDYNTRLTAKGALQHPWSKDHTLDKITVKGPLGNIIKFPGSSGTPVMPAGGNGGSEDGQGGIDN